MKNTIYREKRGALAEIDENTVKGILATTEVDKQNERITPEALNDWATRNAGEPIHMFREHKREVTLGEWGTLTVRKMAGTKDDYELYGEGEFYPELSTVADAKALIKRDRLKDVSVGMRIGDLKFTPDGLSFGWVDVREASLVTFGANGSARLVESAQKHIPLFSIKNDSGAVTLRGLDRLLRATDLNEEERTKLLQIVTGAKPVEPARDAVRQLWEAMQS